MSPLHTHKVKFVLDCSVKSYLNRELTRYSSKIWPTKFNLNPIVDQYWQNWVSWPMKWTLAHCLQEVTTRKPQGICGSLTLRPNIKVSKFFPIRLTHSLNRRDEFLCRHVTRYRVHWTLTFFLPCPTKIDTHLFLLILLKEKSFSTNSNYSPCILIILKIHYQ